MNYADAISLLQDNGFTTIEVIARSLDGEKTIRIEVHHNGTAKESNIAKIRKLLPEFDVQSGEHDSINIKYKVP